MLQSKSISGWTVLIQAASEGKLDFVRWLIESGAKVNTTMGSGWTALHAASMNGHVEVRILSYLLITYVMCLSLFLMQFYTFLLFFNGCGEEMTKNEL